VAIETGELRRAGRVVYGVRAFEQDAQDAMRGDIVRGLIECVTNSDDAYARMGDAAGKIRIEVEHRRGAAWRVIVRDRATGMTQGELVTNIVELGGRASGFEEGKAVRGNLGRGAKDLPAFGPTLFVSIKDDQYAALLLKPTGDYEVLARPHRATRVEREQLGIPRGNGTVVTVFVADSIRCPNHGTLKKRLSSHFHLRDIMADAKREVVLVNANSPSEQDKLSYPFVETPLVRSVDLAIPEYPTKKATLEVHRLPARCEDPPSDPCRPTGILIKGRRAIYENTLFSFEGNPYAAFLHGRLVCVDIDTLAREYDDRQSAGRSHPPNNPIPIISRTRDGLRHEHPFYAALRTAAEGVLKEIVEEEEERIKRDAARIENQRTRRDLDRLAAIAARFMEEELRNAEAEELPHGARSGEAIKPLAVIPSEAVCYMAEQRTLTVVARRDGLAQDAAVSVTTDPQGVVELVDGSSVPLRPHRRRDDLMVGQIRLQPLVPELAVIQCELDGRHADALVEVLEEHKPPPPPPPPPTTLEFERPRYRIGWTRTKLLKLRAPREQCEAGSVVKVSSSSPGIVVLTNRVPMEFDVHAGFVAGEVRVEGRALGAEGTIQATFEAVEAKCRAVVTRDEGALLPKFQLEDKDGGKYRALWEEREDAASGERMMVLEIMGRHPALRRYLGAAPDFPGQNTPLVKAMMAEIVADNVCREVARRVDALRQSDERPDSEGFYAEHYNRMLKLLPLLHEVEVPALPQPESEATDGAGS